jgi:hypothetical protein
MAETFQLLMMFYGGIFFVRICRTWRWEGQETNINRMTFSLENMAFLDYQFVSSE